MEHNISQAIKELCSNAIGVLIMSKEGVEKLRNVKG